MVKFKPQNLSNIIWAFATAKIPSTLLFDNVAYEVIEYRDLKSFKPQNLSIIVWAFATAKGVDRSMFEKVATEVSRRDLRSFILRIYQTLFGHMQHQA